MLTIYSCLFSVFIPSVLVLMSALYSIVFGAWGHVVVGKKEALLAAGLVDG